MVLVLGCIPSLSQTVPINYILLGTFTFCEAYMISCITSLYDPYVVLSAALLTAGVTISLTLHALTCKRDYTIMGASMIMLLSSLFLTGLLNIWIRSDALTNLMLFGSTVLYGGYLLYDTQLLMGGKRRELSLDNYILGAMLIYSDVITLFIKIL